MSSCESISHESNNSDNISKPISAEEEEADTDLETDRLLGQQRLDEQIYFDDKVYYCFCIFSVCSGLRICRLFTLIS